MGCFYFFDSRSTPSLPDKKRLEKYLEGLDIKGHIEQDQGPDNFHLTLLSKALPYMERSLQIQLFFRQSLDSTQKDWTRANVTQLFKKVPRLKAEN